MYEGMSLGKAQKVRDTAGALEDQRKRLMSVVEEDLPGAALDYLGAVAHHQVAIQEAEKEMLSNATNN